MTDITSLIAFLKQAYPQPEINPEWIRDCVQALTEAGEQPTTEAVVSFLLPEIPCQAHEGRKHEQYLFSDLAASTLDSRLIPPSAHKTSLFRQATLLQIHSITEIGSSAFQLQTIVEQRRDILDGATRIRRMDDEEAEEEIEDGKLPNYPRGMLKLSVGDGRKVVDAIEYRRLDELKLGDTALGAKLLVQNVKVLRNILLLSPENTQILGYSVDHLQADQGRRFVTSLKHRLGRSASPKPPASAVQAIQAPAAQRSLNMRAAPPPAPSAARPPPRAPSTAAQQARAAAILGMAIPQDSSRIPSAIPSSRTLSSSSPPPIVRPTPRRLVKALPTSRKEAPPQASPSKPRQLTLDSFSSQPDREAHAGPSKRKPLNSASAARPSRKASKAAAARLEALYAQPIQIEEEDEDDAVSYLAPPTVQHTYYQGRQAYAAAEEEFEADDSFFQQIDDVVHKTGAKRQAMEAYEEDEFEADDSFIRHLDEAEGLAGSFGSRLIRAEPVTHPGGREKSKARGGKGEREEEKENRGYIEISSD